ncbi:hypothetical protein AB0M22_29925 [Nocardia sp. NPDC051756]|uniref:hypothetical protein n=1 Tax=Nocardia sp. NPDC051756 TaxID=3154751 RepID=UPI0034312F81
MTVKRSQRSAGWVARAVLSVSAAGTVLVAGGGCATEEGPPIVPGTAPPSTSYLNSSSVIDRDNPAAVAGAATDIFFAQVVESMGSTERRGQLESQFGMEVTERLKGAATGRVTVNQRGGLKDRTVVVENGDELLVMGQSYLIAARYSEDQDWYTLIPVAGDIPVTGGSSPRSTVHRRPEERAEVRNRMNDAITRQIPFTPSGSTGKPDPPGTRPPATATPPKTPSSTTGPNIPPTTSAGKTSSSPPPTS